MDMRKISVLLLALSFMLCAVHLPGQAEGSVLGTSILGTIVSEDGAAFSGVRIEAVNATTSHTFTAFSGVDGNYSMPLDPGLYNVIASLPNHTANVSYAGVLVTLGQEVHLNFTVSEVLCTLTGYVTNGTQPVYGATVTLLNSQYNYTGVSINPLGQYVIDRVNPGTYTVIADKAGYYPSDAQPPIEMVRNVTKNLDFEMEEQPANLTGIVVYQGDGVTGVKVVLSTALFTADTFTDENGNYSFQLVPAGSYTITFTKDKYQVKERSVSLSPFEVKRLDVELEYDSENNTKKFILNFDLAHSLMIVGLIASLIVLVIGLYVNYKVRKKPELLEREREKDESKKE